MLLLTSIFEFVYIATLFLQANFILYSPILSTLNFPRQLITGCLKARFRILAAKGR